MNNCRLISKQAPTFLLLCVLIVVSLSLSGCGSQPAYPSQGTGQSLAETTGSPESTETMSATGGSTIGAGVGVEADPALTGAHPGGGPTEKPELLWTFRTNSSSCPAVSDHVLYVGSEDGFYALDATSGEQEWRADEGEVINSSPAVADGRVYFGDDDGWLHALDVTSGHR